MDDGKAVVFHAQPVGTRPFQDQCGDQAPGQTAGEQAVALRPAVRAHHPGQAQDGQDQTEDQQHLDAYPDPQRRHSTRQEQMAGPAAQAPQQETQQRGRHQEEQDMVIGMARTAVGQDRRLCQGKDGAQQAPHTTAKGHQAPGQDQSRSGMQDRRYQKACPMKGVGKIQADPQRKDQDQDQQVQRPRPMGGTAEGSIQAGQGDIEPTRPVQQPADPQQTEPGIAVRHFRNGQGQAVDDRHGQNQYQ